MNAKLTQSVGLLRVEIDVKSIVAIGERVGNSGSIVYTNGGHEFMVNETIEEVKSATMFIPSPSSPPRPTSPNSDSTIKSD